MKNSNSLNRIFFLNNEGKTNEVTKLKTIEVEPR